MISDAGYVFGDGGATEYLQKINTMGNRDLRWEKTKGYNIGFDFALFNNRINGSLELYQTTTHDLLYDVAIPTMTGFASVSSNIGKIRNRGVEFTVTSRNFMTCNFEWSPLSTSQPIRTRFFHCWAGITMGTVRKMT